MLGGAEREQYGRTITHLFFYTAEEALEMTGVSLFIYTLLSYIELTYGELKVSVSCSASPKN